MTLSDQIRTDREAGTPGPWRAWGDTAVCKRLEGDAAKELYGEKAERVTIPIASCNRAGATLSELTANARRIARVPELEEIALAAAEFVRLRDIYNATPTDRGGKNGPKGKAHADVVNALVRLWKALGEE